MKLCCPQCKTLFSDLNLDKALNCLCGLSFSVSNGIPQLVLEKESGGKYTPKQTKKLKELEENHFWFKARRVLILDLLKKFLLKEQKRVLDVGCGTGKTLSAICQEGLDGVGIDLQGEALFEASQSYPSIKFVQGSATALPFCDHTFDAVILADVLEHIDDQLALAEAYRVLKPKGCLLITVPAFPFLWSERDEAAGHLRRYIPSSLKRLIGPYSFTWEVFTAYQFFLFPLRLLTSLYKISPSNEENISPWINTILFRINLFEIKLGRFFSWPWGTSLVVLLRKK